jgi:hypothetical protein
MTFHCRGMTSSVSVMSSPIFTMRADPQQVQEVGASTTTRSRGRCSGNGLRAGRRRSKAATVVFARRHPLCPILPKVGLEVLELHLELFDQPGMAFGAVAILLAAEFGDLERKVPDHVFGGRDDRLNLGPPPWRRPKSSAAGARASAAARAARRTAISEGVSDMPKTYHKETPE